MNQRQLSSEPEVYTFREQKILDYLVFLNEHYPTASRYPVRLLRIKEKRIVPSHYPGRRWYLCPNCKHVFLEDLGDYTYSYRPHAINLIGTYFVYEDWKHKKAIHCCSKSCLAGATVKFAIESLTEEGKKYIHLSNIKLDINTIIEKFHCID